MHLFHYHLVTSKVREVEARYLGKLGFTLVARHGRIGEDTTSFESGYGWEDLDRMGFKLRLSALERGGVNVVVQPGQWEFPELKASTLGELLAAPYTHDSVMVGDTLVRFVPDGPQGRPQLHAELFV